MSSLLKQIAIPLLVVECVLCFASKSMATVFSGNGATGFGGGVGNGSLTVTDDGTNLTLSLATSGSSLNGNSFVLYLSTGAAGISDTSSLMDNQDGGRTAISGYNGSNAFTGSSTPVVTQTVATFPTGFTASYALSFEDGYVGLFALPPNQSATSTNLTYITGMSQNGEPDVVTFPLADIGVSQAQSFALDGTLISTTAYRSNETIGASSVASNPGFTGGLTFSGYDTYTTTPEPASIGILAAGGISYAEPQTQADRMMAKH